MGIAAACNLAPQTPEETLLLTRCGRCHQHDHALNKRKSARGWERTVWAMRQRGAALSDQEAQSLVRYLSKKRGLQ
jgi:cytochrome c553